MIKIKFQKTLIPFVILIIVNFCFFPLQYVFFSGLLSYLLIQDFNKSNFLIAAILLILISNSTLLFAIINLNPIHHFEFSFNISYSNCLMFCLMNYFIINHRKNLFSIQQTPIELLFFILIALYSIPIFQYYFEHYIIKPQSLNFVQSLMGVSLVVALYILGKHILQHTFHLSISDKINTFIYNDNYSFLLSILFLISLHPFDKIFSFFILGFSFLARMLKKTSIKFNAYQIVLISLIILSSNDFIKILKGLLNPTALISYANEYYILHAIKFSELYLVFILGLTAITFIKKRKTVYFGTLGIILLSTIFPSDKYISLNNERNKVIAALKPFESFFKLAPDNTLSIPRRTIPFDIEQYSQLKYYKSLFKSEPKVGFNIQHSLFKLKKYNSNLPPLKHTINLYLGLNESESFQIITTPFCDSVRVDSILTNNNHEFHIECLQGKFIYCKKPYYKPDLTGYITDPLIPLQDSPNITYKNQSRSFFINITTFKNTPITHQKLDVKIYYTVFENNTPIKKKYSFPVNIDVFNIDLNTIDKLPNAFGYHPLWKNHFSGFKQKNHFDDYKFLQHYKLTPVSIYSSTHPFPPLKDRTNWKNEPHPLSFIQVNNKKEADQTILRMDSLYKIAVQIGIHEKAYWYAFDEIKEKEIKWLKYIYNHKKDPLPILVSGIPDSRTLALDKLQWVTLPKDNNKTTKQDKWWYVCNTHLPPEYNFFIDQYSIKHKMLFYEIYSKNIKGLLFWSLTDWGTNCLPDVLKTSGYSNNETKLFNDLKLGNRWPKTHWNSYTYKDFNGDGAIIYPGKDNTLYPSTRLINIRDGLEEYQLLKEFDRLYPENNLIKIKAKNFILLFKSNTINSIDLEQLNAFKKELLIKCSN